MTDYGDRDERGALEAASALDVRAASARAQVRVVVLSH